MVPNPRRLAVLALYQFSLALGILLLPVALVTRKIGISLPFHRIVSRLGEAYERSSTQ